MKKISCCRTCRSKHIKTFLSLGRQPLANSLLKSPNQEEKKYPLSLSFCSNCRLVQLNHTIDPKELFSHYIWLTSTSKTAREQASIFCEQVLLRTKNLDTNYSYILEVASNDGTFLKPFIKKGYRVLGVDPAKNIVNLARKNKIPTLEKFFGIKAAKEIKKEFGPAKVIIARNVLAHVADLADFVKGLDLVLADDGLLAVEVHYAKNIYEGTQYDSIYHEHLCYFTLKSAEYLFNQYHLFVVDVGESPISGGSLILYIKKQKKESALVQKYRIAEEKNGLNKFSGWQGFAKQTYSHQNKLVKLLEEIIKKNGPVVGYGASARSSTLLNFCVIDTRLVSVIADQNIIKHNYFTAGTHIPIKNPYLVMKEKPKYVLILAWNFAEEIMMILKEKYHFKGRCILPLPDRPKIVKIPEKK
ncbi:hypothetical protein A2160_02640 [Candidatus Beckwithbacteria bacterium RBG_13_42_9]|uniref:Methyltransferase n=1 Tax=Candidatus Beckwithbacteria bacterium RBG_13_42_9 TaxID=1797457 RepID=A0A1F5E7H7_9BACT|nr:MAG: hypothetical protein A2160_02640 [Candidatus Beckwithbacteria bacterium RBG_13_42_9]